MNFTKDTAQIVAVGAVIISVASTIYTTKRMNAMQAELDEFKKQWQILNSNIEQYKLELRTLQGIQNSNVETRGMGIPPNLPFVSRPQPAHVHTHQPAHVHTPQSQPLSMSTAHKESPRVSVVSEELFTRPRPELDVDTNDEDAYGADEDIVRALRSQMMSNSAVI